MKHLCAREATGGYIIEVSEEIDIINFTSTLSDLTPAGMPEKEALQRLGKELSKLGFQPNVGVKEFVAKNKDELIERLRTIVATW